MKSFKIDRTKIIAVMMAAVVMGTMITGCKKKPVVTSLATTEATTTTEITTAESTTEETTTEETTTTEEETTTTTTAEITTTTTEEETTKATKKKKTATTTKKTTTYVGKIKVTSYRAKVYAKGKMNVRSGPGTNYKIVKTLEAGDGIDVRGKTNNGWYKTINGNYVLASLTTTKKPANANNGGGNFE